MDLLLKYFPDLDAEQQARFAALLPLYAEWNAKINVISRKDIDNLYERHVLHALAPAKVLGFAKGARILDLGTGGGFPGIPLAILYPDVHFMLVDGTGKKISVVRAVAEALGLRNVEAEHIRAEDIRRRHFDFVVSRAVAPLDQLLAWSRRLISREQRHVLPNGILALKGGNIKAEMEALPKGEYAEAFPISAYFTEAFFAEKAVLYVQG